MTRRPVLIGRMALPNPRRAPSGRGAAVLSEELRGLVSRVRVGQREAPWAPYGLGGHTYTKIAILGHIVINGADPSGDDGSDDFYNEDWITGVHFYECNSCWTDTDSFNVEVIPGVYLRGELHREVEWDYACITSARLRLTDLRGM